MAPDLLFDVERGAEDQKSWRGTGIEKPTPGDLVRQAQGLQNVRFLGAQFARGEAQKGNTRTERPRRKLKTS